jgi:mersacidin/lichenicidin family type 2 lantibiotic
MSSEDTIRAWKDPDQRVGGHHDEHPAGRIELPNFSDSAVGGTDTAEICTSILISIGFSNLIHCADSVMHGTCGAFSVGCCAKAAVAA